MAVVAYFAFSKPAEVGRPKRSTNSTQQATQPEPAMSAATFSTIPATAAQTPVRAPVTVVPASATTINAAPPAAITPPPRPAQPLDGGGGLLSTFGLSHDEPATEAPKIAKPAVPDAVEKK
jgi:hypothetical protein